MFDRNNIFDYYLIDSHIHKLNYTYKMLSVILLFFCIVIADSFVDMLVINFFIFVVMLYSNVSIRMYLNNLVMFKFILVLIFLIFSLIYFDWFVGLIWMVKIFDIIMYISIITMTTAFGNIVYGIYGILRPLKKYININESALKIGLAIKFVNFLYTENHKVCRSKMLRGVRFRDMNIFDRIKTVVVGIKPAYKLALKKTMEMERIMIVKNYGISLSRCNYRLNKWGKTDTILLVINVLLVIITFIY